MHMTACPGLFLCLCHHSLGLCFMQPIEIPNNMYSVEKFNEYTVKSQSLCFLNYWVHRSHPQRKITVSIFSYIFPDIV